MNHSENLFFIYLKVLTFLTTDCMHISAAYLKCLLLAQSGIFSVQTAPTTPTLPPISPNELAIQETLKCSGNWVFLIRFTKIMSIFLEHFLLVIANIFVGLL